MPLQLYSESLNFAGKMDHTCFTFNGHGYVAGGWNVDFIGARPNMTERYVHGGKEWKTLDASQSNLPHIFRSSAYTVLSNKPAMVGGVGCMVDSLGRTTCTKDKKVYVLRGSLDTTNEENVRWEEYAHGITTPRSSHLVLKVPVTTKFGCELVPTTTTATTTTTAASGGGGGIAVPGGGGGGIAVPGGGGGGGIAVPGG